MTDNSSSINTYYREAVKYLLKILNIRSRKKSFNWLELNERFLTRYPLTRPKLYVNLFN